MPGATAAMSGYGPQEVYVWLSYVSYNQANNYSTWYWELVFKNNGGQQWSSDPNHYWRLQGFATTGNNYFGIPSSWVGTNDHQMGSGYFNKYHNADGYLSAGVLGGYINCNSHSGIGEGYATVSSGTPVRIPKVPDAPPAPVFISAEPDSLTFQIAQPADNGGAAIQTYEMRVTSADGATLIGTWQSGASIQSTPASMTLDPSTSYRVLYKAKNSVGWGPNSAYTTMTTESGIFVSDGANWVGAGPRVSDGSSWVNAPPVISDGAAWQDPLTVLPAPDLIDLDKVSETSVNLFITVKTTGVAHTIQRATDDQFTQGVVETAWTPSTVDNVVPVTGLTNDQRYYWRVKRGNMTVAAFWSNVMGVGSPW